MLISIVMTVYNRERYVAEAIESVLGQTFTDFELIIWDDGSSDNSLEIARSYAKQDTRIRVFASEHLGQSRALDGATRQAQGALLGMVDSDDILLPTALEKTAALLKNNPTAGMVYTHHSEMDEMGQDLGIGRRCKIPYSKERLLLDFMILHFRLIRTDLFWKIGGIDTNFNAALDYNFCLKLSEITEIQTIPEVLYRYRVHRQSISGGKQLEQIRCTYVAISQAMQRRGLSESYDLKLDIKPWFSIRNKQSKADSSQNDTQQERDKAMASQVRHQQ
ncbi:MAG: glycosyltransferase [Cyanobacteria bacterium J06597_1]